MKKFVYINDKFTSSLFMKLSGNENDHWSFNTYLNKLNLSVFVKYKIKSTSVYVHYCFCNGSKNMYDRYREDKHIT